MPYRYWLVETRNPDNVVTDARLIYRKLAAVPYLAKFVVFAKFSADGTEARLRIFCITDDKVDKTLEGQTGFIEVARSRDVEVGLLKMFLGALPAVLRIYPSLAS